MDFAGRGKSVEGRQLPKVVARRNMPFRVNWALSYFGTETVIGCGDVCGKIIRKFPEMVSQIIYFSDNAVLKIILGLL